MTTINSIDFSKLGPYDGKSSRSFELLCYQIAKYEYGNLGNFTAIDGSGGDGDIERQNLNFRTHLKRLSRKTICFSRNETIHDNVISMYIERNYYKAGFRENLSINGYKT